MARTESPELRRWLTAIGSLTTAVNAGHGLSSLLDLVADTARELLDLDFCGVMLPTADGTSLRLVGASTPPAGSVARMGTDSTIPVETATTGAPASRAFRSGRPCTVTDVAAEPDLAWTAVARGQGFGSILAVPLVTRAGVLGTLNSYHASAYEFPVQEVEQLELLAEHAAMALTSAQIVHDLREQHRSIVRSEEVHDRLLRVAVRSGGVSGITTALRDLLSCDVVVRDHHDEVLATAEATGAGGGSATVPAPSDRWDLVREEGADVVADVVLDGAAVAAVSLAGRAGTLDAQGRRALEHASVVLSMELLRQRTAAEVEQALRGELLTDLLAGTDPGTSSVRERAALMGHDLATPHRTFVAEPAGTGDGPPGAGRDGRMQRAAAEALRLAARTRPRPLVAAVHGALVALWPATSEVSAGVDVLRRAIRTTSGGAARVAVAEPNGDGIPATYRLARGVLAFASSEDRADRVLTLDDLGAAGLLLRYADPAELHRYAENTLGAVRRYDDDHGTALVRTLRIHLDCDLDRRRTAEHLVLHPNTVSQRLRRIETLTGLDLRSARAVIDARTALLLIDVAAARHGPPNTD